MHEQVQGGWEGDSCLGGSLIPAAMDPMQPITQSIHHLGVPPNTHLLTQSSLWRRLGMGNYTNF